LEQSIAVGVQTEEKKSLAFDITYLLFLEKKKNEDWPHFAASLTTAHKMKTNGFESTWSSGYQSEPWLRKNASGLSHSFATTSE
jgi:hypothetical protein